MPLTLRIENMASLPDGGPIEMTSTGAPLRVGRKPGNDWILPDPSNWISGFHFEVIRVDAAWFLTDRSSNGTFLVGQSYRIEGSYRLNQGDRLQVGHYYIAVAITPDPPAAPPPPPVRSGLTAAPFAAAPPAGGPAIGAPAIGAPGLVSPGIGPVGGIGPGGIGLGGIGLPPAAEPPGGQMLVGGASIGVAPSAAAAIGAPPIGALSSPQPGLVAPPMAAPGLSAPPTAAPGWGVGAPHRAPPVVEEADPWAVGPAAAPAARPVVPVPGFTPPPFSAPPIVPIPAQPPPLSPHPTGIGQAAAPVPGIGIGVPPPPLPVSAAAMPHGDFGADFIVTPASLRQEGTPYPAKSVAPVAAPAPAGFDRAAATPPAAIAMPMPEAQVPPGAPAPAGPIGDVFLRAFCEGAGLSPGDLGGVMTEAFAHEIGRTMRIVATELMSLLQDRATAKRFTRGGERTMISTDNNNPLKFLPDATQALEAMFLRPRAGFLKGGDGVAAGLADVRLHQTAVFAAIQPALARLLSDLAPEAIDDGGEGAGLFGGTNKKKLWETYVERWDAKAGAHDNGMLDVFLQHFAESYAAAVDAARR